MFCCRSHGDGDIGLPLEYSRGCKGICNHPPLLWIVNNIVTFKLCSQKFNPNQKILLKIRTALINDSSKIVKKFSQMQNLGQLGPENCRAYVFFACFFCFVFVLFCFLFFPLFFFFLFPPFFFFFYSSPDLNLHLYSILHDFSFKNTKFSASEKAHPPQTPPVCASMQLALTLHQIIPQCRRRMYSPL